MNSHLVGGFVGGLTSSVILQPFDLVKTRVQQDSSSTITSTIKGLKSIKELWRGTLPSAMRTSVGSALYLTSLNGLRSLYSTSSGSGGTVGSSKLPKLSMVNNLITGGIARGVIGVVTMPITVVKVRYESTIYQYKSIGESVRLIWRHEGLRGFFKGVLPTVARDAPYSGLYVLLYEQFKVVMPYILKFDRTASSNGELFSTTKSTLINSASGFIAASVATTITSPFDTIKTRMQLEPQKYTSFFTSLRLISRDGLTSLFDGLSLRLVRKAFSAGIAWGIYEEIVKLNL